MDLCTLFYEIAQLSYFPFLVAKDQEDGYGKVETHFEGFRRCQEGLMSVGQIYEREENKIAWTDR